jgi:hypothetical protein
MRTKEINIINNYSSKDFSLGTSAHKKTLFPTLSQSPKGSRIARLKKRNSLSLQKTLNSEMKNTTFTKRPKINPNIKMVNILNFEEDIDKILNSNLELKKKREKLDKNKTIKLLRLGLYKKKENNNTNNNINDVETIAEKEKENEEDLNKITIENRDREKKLEKQLREYLYNFEQYRDECQKINNKIISINQELEEKNLESNVLVTYAEEFDKKFEEKLNVKQEKEEKEEKEDNMDLVDNNNNSNDSIDPQKKKNKNQYFENMNKLYIFKQKRENKKKEIQETILIKESIKKKLVKDLMAKRELCNQAKKNLYVIRKQLINSYHLKLYEGLDFRGEGLSTIIKDIWNLGVNVNINYMPPYLDGPAIEFLFKKANQSIEISRIRQVIKDNENELASYIKEWKKSNKEIKELFEHHNQFGLNVNENIEENKKNDMNEEELFKTKVSDISLSYLTPYPKTKQFMIDYKKKHPNLFHKEIPSIEIKKIPFKSLNIPLKITEKNQHIEKLKYLLGIKIEQNKEKDRKEVERLNREFTKNDYKAKYEVNIETVFGALFGEEKKNEMLIYYTKLDKEFRDGKKLIQFHTKINLKMK